MPFSKLNRVMGENESGKSTILLVVTYMMYGLAKKGADRDRSVSFENGKAQGQMVLEMDGRDYRIVRALKGKTTSSKVSVIDLESGEEIAGVAPHELFLEGVSREGKGRGT